MANVAAHPGKQRTHAAGVCRSFHRYFETIEVSMESPERYRYIIGTADTIKEMLENQGWTVSAIDHNLDNPYCGSVTAGKGDIQAVTYYFEYHTLADIEEQYKRIG
jgi:hypothetical protein